MSYGSRSKMENFTLNALRIVAGFLFSLHGFQKMFGVLGREESVEILSMMGAAGVIELVAGLAIMFGLFTRPLAFLASGEMAVAYFMVHVGGAETLVEGIFPVLNGGERAALYSFIFLLLFAFGPGSFSLDEVIFGRQSDLPPLDTEGPDLAET